MATASDDVHVGERRLAIRNRAKERPTVSTPVGWDEIEAAVDAGDRALLVFEMRDVLARVECRGDLFAPTLSLSQRLAASS